MNSAILEKESESIAVDPNEILTVHQAHVLKVSYSHMLRLIRGEVSGMPPVHHVRAGRSVRIRRGALTESGSGTSKTRAWPATFSAPGNELPPNRHRPSVEGEPSTMLNSEHSKPTPANQEKSLKRRRFQKGSLQLRRRGKGKEMGGLVLRRR